MKRSKTPNGAAPTTPTNGRARFDRRLLFVAPLLVASCQTTGDRQTLAGLRTATPDLAEVEVKDGIDQAMDGYRQFLEKAPTSTLTPEAMRRLADLKLEKEYGALGEPKIRPIPPTPILSAPAAPRPSAPSSESIEAFEARATAPTVLGAAETAELPSLPGAPAATTTAGPLEALALYDQILTTSPAYPHNDQVLYQKARALDELGRVDEAIETFKLVSLDGGLSSSTGIKDVGTQGGSRLLISQDGTVIRQAAEGISRMGRSTQGVRLMNLRSGDKVSSIARVTEPSQPDAEDGAPELPLDEVQEPDPPADTATD